MEYLIKGEELTKIKAGLKSFDIMVKVEDPWDVDSPGSCITLCKCNFPTGDAFCPDLIDIQ